MSENTENTAVELDEGKLVGELTVAEFRALMASIKPARRSYTRKTPVEAPEGYTLDTNGIIERSGLHPMTVRRLCRDGAFGEDGCVKVGNRWMCKPEAVDAYLEAQKAKEAAKAAKAAKPAADAEAEAEPAAADEVEDIDLDELDLDSLEADEE